MPNSSNQLWLTSHFYLLITDRTLYLMQEHRLGGHTGQEGNQRAHESQVQRPINRAKLDTGTHGSFQQKPAKGPRAGRERDASTSSQATAGRRRGDPESALKHHWNKRKSLGWFTQVSKHHLSPSREMLLGRNPTEVGSDLSWNTRSVSTRTCLEPTWVTCDVGLTALNPGKSQTNRDA